jgi:DNA-binding response OmpR family regulator
MTLLRQSTGRTILLVDPDPSLLETRRLLLLSAGYSVQTACAARDVFAFQPEDEPEIVVLSDALGSVQLLAVAEYVRHRWPRARIVIIGKAGPLEDQLYDETVDAPLNPTEFLAALRPRSHDQY